MTGERYPRLQVITVAELLDGKGIDYPGRVGTTFRRAPRVKERPAETESLFAIEDDDTDDNGD